MRQTFLSVNFYQIVMFTAHHRHVILCAAKDDMARCIHYPAAGPPSRPGSVILAGSRMRASSSSERFVFSRATSRIVLPVRCASFAGAAAASEPITGARAVQLARPRSTNPGPLVFALGPFTHGSLKL